MAAKELVEGGANTGAKACFRLIVTNGHLAACFDDSLVADESVRSSLRPGRRHDHQAAREWVDDCKNFLKRKELPSTLYTDERTVASATIRAAELIIVILLDPVGVGTIERACGLPADVGQEHGIEHGRKVGGILVQQGLNIYFSCDCGIFGHILE